MIKHILMMTVIAAAVTVLAPRDMSDVARLMIQAAGALVQLAVRLDPPVPATDDEADDRNHAPQQDAALSPGVLFNLAERRIFRGTPMPQGRGCRETHCEDRWDDELQRRFRRCYWRCPRPAPPQEIIPEPAAPRQYETKPVPRVAPPSYNPRRYKAGAGDNVSSLALLTLGIIALIIITVLSNRPNRRSRDIDKALDEAAALAAAKAKLDAATAEADAVIARFRARSGAS